MESTGVAPSSARGSELDQGQAQAVSIEQHAARPTARRRVGTTAPGSPFSQSASAGPLVRPNWPYPAGPRGVWVWGVGGGGGGGGPGGVGASGLGLAGGPIARVLSSVRAVV